MATIVDALLVTLGLDDSEFKKGSDEVAKAQKKISDTAGQSARQIEQQEKKLSDAQAKRAKELEARSKQIAQGFTKIRNEALALFAAFTGGVGLKNFFEHTISTAAGLSRMSDNLGMSAKDLSMWQLAAKNAGGTADGMTAQLKQAASDIAVFKMGYGPTATLQASFLYGVNESDLKNANTLLLAQSKILKKMYDVDPTKAMQTAKLMGISEDTFNLLKQGPEAVEKQRQAQASLAEEMANAAKPAEELRKKMDALGNSFNASSVKIVTAFIPALQSALSIMQKVATAMNDDQFMGEATARILAFFGVKEAQDALRINGATKKRKKTPGVHEMLGFKYGKTTAMEIDALQDAPKSGATQLERQKYMMGRLKKDGYSDAQAAGIVGSLMQESQLNPNAVNPKSGAVGIAQWLSKGRRKTFAQQYGHTIEKSSFEEQVNYMMWELRNTEERSGNLIRKAKDAKTAAALHAWEYERPGVLEANIKNRQRNAENVLSMAGTGGAMASVNMATRATAPASVTNTTNNSTTDVKVGQINVQTQAKDAEGIAKSIGGAVRQYGFVPQANTGLS